MNISNDFRLLMSLMSMSDGNKIPLDGMEKARDRVKRRALEFCISDQSVRVDAGSGVKDNQKFVTYTPGQEAIQEWSLIYIHGGGFVFYDLDIYGGFLRLLSKELNMEVVGVDYPKLPENKYPSIIHHIKTVAEEIRSKRKLPGKIALAGDSVGAFMALHLASSLMKGQFEKLILIYPVVDFRNGSASWSAYGKNYFLDSDVMDAYRSYFERDNVYRDFRVFEGELAKGLPEVVLFSCEFDILRDSAFELVEKLKESGVQYAHRHFEDMPHDFCLYGGKLKSSRNAIDQMIKVLRISFEQRTL